MEKVKVTVLYDSIEDEEQPPGTDAPVYRQVAQVLERRGHEVLPLAADRNIRKLVSQIDRDDSTVIFNLCESLGGVDRHSIHVAALLELMGKRFTGAGAVGLTLAQDKALSKKLLQFHGIRCPKFSVMHAGEVEWSDDLQFPLFVKPADQDSSVGIDENAVVKDIKMLMDRISFIHTEIHAPVLIEEYIEGREIYVGVLGNEKLEDLPILEWDFSRVEGAPPIATARAKWDKSSQAYRAPEVFPGDIPEEVSSAMAAAAIEACRTLKIWDYARVDMRLRPSSEKEKDPGFYLIEVNPNPYLHPKAELALAARKKGYSYPDLIEKILELALRRGRGSHAT